MQLKLPNKRFLFRHIGFVAFIVWCIGLPSALADNETLKELQRDRADAAILAQAKHYALVINTSVSAPLKKLLLIRQGKQICAVRFMNFKRMWDAGTPSTFTSAEEHMYGEYDWFLPDRGTAGDGRKGLVTGHAKVVRKPTYGIGRLNFQFGGSRLVKCGPFEQIWLYPNRVSMFGGSYPEPPGGKRQFAPTAWENWEDVNLNNPKLKWYQYDDLDSGDRNLQIPIKDLPGGEN